VRNFSVLVISLFAIVLFFSGCSSESSTPKKTNCLTIADCKEGTECRFSDLESETGSCVAMTKCETAAECEGRQCNQSLIDDTMYCGYSAEPFGINSATLPDGLVGENYTFTLTVKGSAAPFYFEMKEGSVLPVGLTLSENGVISGTPSEAKTNYSFDVVAFNGAKGSEYFYNYRKVEATFTINITDDACANVNCGEKPNSHCVEGECVCDTSYHANGELCESNTKMVDCDDAAPQNATSVIEQVEITWNNGEWSQPSRCGWECNTDYAVEAGTSCINKKMTTCKDVAPEDATSVVAEVEISYTTADGWAEPANCAWNCDETFHLNGEVCESNSQMVACLENGAPANADYVNVSVEITWNNGEWSTAANCAWTCNTTYHQNGQVCESNTKSVACTQSGAPANASYVAGNVEVTWVNNQWTTAANCAWTCNATYHTEDNLTCISNTKSVACTQSGAPTNASYVAGNVNVTWNGSSWTTAANCAWTCNATYHTEDNTSCISNTKSVSCSESGAPANSEYIAGIVEVNWVNNQWTIPANCFWQCIAEYHEENGSCVPDETGPCAGNPCLGETNSTEVCVVTGETTYTCECVDNYFYDDISGNCETACDPLFNASAPDCSGTAQHCEATSLTLASCVCDDGYVDVDATTALDCQEAYNGNDICDANAPIIDADGVYLGSTADAVSNFGRPGKDVYYQLVLTQPSIVDVWMESLGDGFDTVLYLNQSCSATTYLYYNDDSTLHGGVGAENSSFVTGILPAGTYFIITDGWYDYSNGLFNLHVDITSYEDVCANNPCTEANKTTCTQTGETTFTCSCDSGYFASGTACVNPCDSVTCPTVNGNGTCTATSATAYSCGCSDGYFYDSISNSCISPCDPNICPTENNGGTGVCTPLSMTNYSCGCQPGYTYEKINGTPFCTMYGVPGSDTCTDLGTTPIINSDGIWAGDTTTATANYTNGTTGAGNDVVYQLVLAQPSKVDLWMETDSSTGFDTYLYLKSSCSATTALFNNDDSSVHLPGNKNSSFVTTILQPGTYIVVVDGYFATNKGLYKLHVDITEYANLCSPNPCIDSHKSVCSQTETTYSCACDSGYFTSGTTCVSPCDPNTCPDVNNGGTGVCTATSATVYTCGCQPGYSYIGGSCVMETALQGADTCSDLDAVPVIANGIYLGDTTTAAANFTRATSASGNDVVYKIILTQQSTVALWQESNATTGFDTYLYLKNACDNTTTALIYNDDSSTYLPAAKNSSFTTSILQPGTYYVFVDGYNTTAKGLFKLHVAITPLCGNGTINAPEQCDSANLNSQTCQTQGFDNGTLGCTSSCTFDTTQCTMDTEYCGDGILNGTEDCDENDIIFTCDDYQAGYIGTVTCNSDCTMNYSQCSPSEYCGDGILNGTEDCDESDIIFTCDDYQAGYVGSVSCNSDCTMNYSLCSPTEYCGDEIANGDDECDGSDIVFTCNDYMEGYIGTTTCNADCTTNYSQCSAAGINIGWCSTQWPLTFTVDENVESPTLYGQVYALNTTEAAGEPTGITAHLCYTTDATLATGITCVDAIWDQQIGSNDQFATWVTIATAGTYYYYYEFSGNGADWVKCDLSDPANGTAYNMEEIFQGVVGTATINAVGPINPQFANNNFSAWTSDTVATNWGGTNALITVSKDITGTNQPSVHLNSPATTTSNMYGLESDFIVANANKPQTITFSMKGSGKMSINIWCDTNGDNLSTGEQKFYNLDTTGSDIKFETSGSNAYNPFAAADWTTYSVEIGTTLDTLWTEGKNCKIQFKVGKTYLFDASIDDVVINY